VASPAVMRSRTKARTDDQIRDDIERLKQHARPELAHIHLIKSDFERVVRDPKYFDATKRPDGSIVTVFNLRLIDIVALS